MSTTASPELIETLRGFDTCSVANAVETFQVRLRNEGFANSSVRCMFPRLGTMVGHAVTVRIRSSSPPPVGEAYPDRTDWWQHIETVPSPRVVIIQDMDQKPGLGAFIGEMHARILQTLACVGAITNGAVRDLPGVESSGFHLFAGATAVSHAYVHITEFGHSVDIGGLTVRPGDLVMGDVHGVLTLPWEIVGEIPDAVTKLVEHEQQILQLCNGSTLTPAQLKGLVEGVL
jgi:4-hydroxy-4-methyl-2-oxoglutarate aldolase